MADNPLPAIAELRTQRAQLVDRIAAIDTEIQHHVRAALDAGVHRTDIMDASGLSQARVYQIAKGTRR